MAAAAILRKRQVHIPGTVIDATRAYTQSDSPGAGSGAKSDLYNNALLVDAFSRCLVMSGTDLDSATSSAGVEGPSPTRGATAAATASSKSGRLQPTPPAWCSEDGQCSDHTTSTSSQSTTSDRLLQRPSLSLPTPEKTPACHCLYRRKPQLVTAYTGENPSLSLSTPE